MTALTRKAGREYLEWLKEHPEPETITIHPLALVELAERAQAMTAVVKAIAAETQAVEQECNAAGFDGRGNWHDPQLDGLRGDIEYERSRHRSISRDAGRALEALGHAIEYLTDQFVENGVYDKGDLEAISLLMRLNREVYYECPVAPTLWERVKGWLHV